MDDGYIVRSSWDEVGAYLNAIAERVDPHDFTGVYGIPRGGSVLAAWLSHKLYLPLLSEPIESCIIVDDICDSGSTLSELSNKIGKIKDSCWITVMFCTPGCLNEVIDFYFKDKGDNWVVFPWEK